MGHFRSLAAAATFAFTMIGMANHADAQSDVYTDPLEIEFGKGTWGVMLPSYNLGRGANGAFLQDDLDDPGFIVQLKAIRRFLGTRTSMEAKTWYAFAGANSRSEEGDFAYTNPSNGNTLNATNGRSHLESNTSHYGGEFMLRDTWRSRFGGLSAGMTFTYMAFDQDFESDFNSVRLFNESLESDFVGGKGFVGWDGRLMGYASRIDLMFGYFDVDAQYDFDGRLVPGTRTVTAGGQTGTVEINASTRRFFNIGEVGLSIGAMYIDEMPALVQNDGAVRIGQDSATTVNAMLEWIF